MHLDVYTVEPRFNEVPRGCGNLYVISRLPYIVNLDLTNFWGRKQNVRYIEFQYNYIDDYRKQSARLAVFKIAARFVDVSESEIDQ